jgi:hypothetical protein
MNQDTKTKIITIIILIFFCYVANFAFTYNENKIETSVIETLTAIPTTTMLPTKIPSPTSTATATASPTATPIRNDLTGYSFDFVIGELEKEGFEFRIDNGYVAKGNRIGFGKYKYNKRASVLISEKGYSLVYASYTYDYFGITDETEANIYHPGSGSLIKLIVGDQAYTNIIEPWDSMLHLYYDEVVLCFDGYVYERSGGYEYVTTSIELEQNYYKFGDGPPFKRCDK